MWLKSLSRVRLFATPWTVAHQAPPSIWFSRQEYWSGLPFPSAGDLPNPGITPRSPTLQADALTSEPPAKHYHNFTVAVRVNKVCDRCSNRAVLWEYLISISSRSTHLIGLWFIAHIYNWWWFSHKVVSDSAIPWTAARQAPLSMGILQGRTLEWVAMPSQTRDMTWSPAMQAGSLLLSHQGRPLKIRNASWICVRDS